MSYTSLVDVSTLEHHLDDPNWCLFDCRHQLSDVDYGVRAYAEAHIPGALFMHLDQDLSGLKNGHNGRHPLPDVQQLSARLGQCGVRDGVQVVVYDDAGGMVASRLWWLLRWLGHDRVALLDGGIQAWVGRGKELTDEVPVPVPACFDPRPCDGLVTTGEVLANLGSGKFCVIDARAPDRFRGENETLDPVGGHIPGARNRFFRDNLNADNLFRPASELRREFLAILENYRSEDAILQCGSGVSACHNLLAMEIAGLPGARLYAGSWSEWCCDPARPVAR